MRSLSLFREKVSRRPMKALRDLFTDYMVYIGICSFLAFLLLLKWPLGFVDSVTNFSVREKIINLIARNSNA
jgi:hypothetical protein